MSWHLARIHLLLQGSGRAEDASGSPPLQDGILGLLAGVSASRRLASGCWTALGCCSYAIFRRVARSRSKARSLQGTALTPGPKILAVRVLQKHATESQRLWATRERTSIPSRLRVCLISRLTQRRICSGFPTWTVAQPTRGISTSPAATVSKNCLARTLATIHVAWRDFGELQRLNGQHNGMHLDLFWPIL